MKTRESSRAFLAGLLIGLLTFGFTISAYAGTAVGPTSTATGAGGVVHTANCEIVARAMGDGTKYAQARTAVVTSAAVASGYVGTLPRLYNGSNQVVMEGTWEYTPGTTWGQSTGVTEYDASGERYSHGEHKVWKGSSYSTYGTHRSPSQSTYP
jgi:hypothetical protein